MHICNTLNQLIEIMDNREETMQKMRVLSSRLKDYRFPAEAITAIPGKAGGRLSAIGAAYIMEALTDFFGLTGWELNTELAENLCTFSETGELLTAVSKGTLKVWYEGLVWTSPVIYGSHSHGDTGDKLKSSQTAVLSKASSYLGLGLYVYQDKKTATAWPSSWPEKFSKEELEKAGWDGVIHKDRTIYLQVGIERKPFYYPKPFEKELIAMSYNYSK